MNSIALQPAPAVTRRDKTAALLALPLGLITIAGGIVFWSGARRRSSRLSRSPWAPRSSPARPRVLRGDPIGARILLAAAVAQILFTITKLAIWHETEAVLFGLAALAIAAPLRGHARG